MTIRNRHRVLVSLLFLGVMTVGAATLFEDPFNSDNNWVRASGTLNQTLVNGTYVVENTGGSAGVLRHDASFQDFTYSVTLSPLSNPFNSTGILFCWSSGFEGYMLTISNEKMYTLQKWVRSGSSASTSLITLGWNSFISTTHNVLTISKSGNRFNLFCNSVFLTTVTDASFSSGGVGLYVGPSEKVAFDHALVTNTFEDSIPHLQFCDSFSEDGLDGWRRFSGPGTATVENQALKMTGGAEPRNTILLTNGNYRAAPLKVIVSRAGGNQDGFAGLILMKIDVTMGSQGPMQGYEAYVFKITGKGGALDRHYAAHRLSTSEPIQYSLHQSSHINGTTDTLEVTPTYDFVVNGDTLPNIDFGGGFDFNAAGLIVDSGVVVTFDDFVAGSSCPTTVAHDRQIRLLRNTTPSYMLGGTGILYDPRGRRVGRYDSGSSLARQTRLAPGTYFAAPDGTANRRLRRAIVEVR